MKNVVTPFALLSLALFVTACTGTYKRPDVARLSDDGSTQLITDAKSYESGIVKAFPDIPIPATHKIDLDRSVIFTSPNHTMGKISLVGVGDPDSLFRFFEEQMAAQGWSNVNSFQSATSSLYFAKPGRFVAIIIEADPGIKGTRISINVGPE